VHGRIWVEPNRGGRGSLFHVEIPAASESAEAENWRKKAEANA
jgi:hypothetical protein